MDIVALGASTSSTSINQQLAVAAAHRALSLSGNGGTVHALSLSDYDMPIYSFDREKAGGVPEAAHRFRADLGQGDAIVIAMAEHNGTYTAAFKNTFDWASRIDREIFGGKPMVLLSTSPGGRGGAGVLAAAESTFPRFGADLRASLAIPSFGTSVDGATGEVTDAALAAALDAALARLSEA